MLNPYEIVPLEGGLKFKFITDSGTTYFAFFEAITETLLAPIPTYSFLFGQEKPTSTKYDSRVGHTIVRVLDDFFSSHNDIVLYTPSDTDGRELCRIRLFDIWWGSYKAEFQNDDLEMDRMNVKMGDANLLVTIFFKTARKEDAQHILTSNIPGLIDAGKQDEFEADDN